MSINDIVHDTPAAQQANPYRIRPLPDLIPLAGLVTYGRRALKTFMSMPKETNAGNTAPDASESIFTLLVYNAIAGTAGMIVAELLYHSLK